MINRLASRASRLIDRKSLYIAGGIGLLSALLLLAAIYVDGLLSQLVVSSGQIGSNQVTGAAQAAAFFLSCLLAVFVPPLYLGVRRGRKAGVVSVLFEIFWLELLALIGSYLMAPAY